MALEEQAKALLNEDNYTKEENIRGKNELSSDSPVENEVLEVNSTTVQNELVDNESDDITPASEERACDNEESDILLNKVDQIIELLNIVSTKQEDLEPKIVRSLKDNNSFQIQVRQGMQKELESAEEKLKGDIFIPILKEIAELYVEWQDVLDDLDDGVAKNKITGVFDILKEILEEYGCIFGCSEIDTKRNTKYSKLKNKIPTHMKEKHEMIAKSYNQWIVKEPFIIYPEYVDVYVYNSSFSDNDGSEYNENNKEEQ